MSPGGARGPGRTERPSSRQAQPPRSATAGRGGSAGPRPELTTSGPQGQASLAAAGRGGHGHAQTHIPPPGHRLRGGGPGVESWVFPGLALQENQTFLGDPGKCAGNRSDMGELRQGAKQKGASSKARDPRGASRSLLFTLGG